MSLAPLLESLAEPADTGYNVAAVPDHPGYRIGRGAAGAVVLLTPPDPDPDPPTRLRMLGLDPKVRCRLNGSAGQATEEDQGLVEFRPDDDHLLEPFLEVAAALVRLLGPHPAKGEVSRGMQLLVRLFEQDRSPTGSIVGLWGELLFILQEPDPAGLVDAWHASIDDRFDFATEGVRLEVKTTTKPERIHTFNLAQLLPVQGAETTVVSLMTTSTDTATSVRELVVRLEERLIGSPGRQMKVHQQVAATLGSDWMNKVSSRFDEHQALVSLRKMAASSIPRVDPGPVAVLSVELTVDCTEVAETARTRA